MYLWRRNCVLPAQTGKQRPGPREVQEYASAWGVVASRRSNTSGWCRRWEVSLARSCLTSLQWARGQRSHWLEVSRESREGEGLGADPPGPGGFSPGWVGSWSDAIEF